MPKFDKGKWEKLAKEAKDAGDMRAYRRIKNVIKLHGFNTRAEWNQYQKSQRIPNGRGGYGYNPNGPN